MKYLVEKEDINKYVWVNGREGDISGDDVGHTEYLKGIKVECICWMHVKKEGLLMGNT